MIQRLAIDFYKSITTFECTFDTFNVLVGANNSGKTSVLQAIHLLTSLVQARRLYARDDLNHFVLGAQQILYSPIHQLPAVMPLGAGRNQLTTITADLRSGETGIETVSATIGFRADGSVEVDLTNPAAMEPLSNLANPYTIYLAGFTGLAQVEGYVGYGALRRAVARGHANTNTRNTLRELQEDKIEWQKFQRAVSDVFPNTELEVSFDPQTDEHVMVWVKQGELRLPLDAVGSGTLQAIQILAYLYLFRPRVLLLDEPDSHLHPDNQRRMIRTLWRESEIGYTQVIATTHSRHVLDARPNPARLLVLNAGSPIAGMGIEPITLLMELGAIDETERLASGKIKCVVATEDTRTDAIEHVIFSSGFKRDETLVCSYSGCSNLESAIVLAAFVQHYAPGVALVIHRDRDYIPNTEINQIRDALKNKKVELFVTSGNDIETHYINAEHLVAVYPSLTTQLAQEAIDRAIENGKVETIKAVIRARTDRAFRERNRAGVRGKHPDVGEIAISCHKDVETNPKQMAFGKRTLGLLKQELQRTLKLNPELYVDSPYLMDSDLVAIASRIWPAP